MHPRKLNASEKAIILDAVKRGDYLSKIARDTGFSTSTIRSTAHRAGLVIQKITGDALAAHARKGKNSARRKPVKVEIVQTLQQRYAGLKHSLRWGGGMGG